MKYEITINMIDDVFFSIEIETGEDMKEYLAHLMKNLHKDFLTINGLILNMRNVLYIKPLINGNLQKFEFNGTSVTFL